MSLRVFRLDGSGSQVVTILQEGTGRPLIVSLNGRVFGTVAAPSAGAASDFTLDDGSTLRVRLVERRVQVRRSVPLPCRGACCPLCPFCPLCLLSPSRVISPGCGLIVNERMAAPGLRWRRRG